MILKRFFPTGMQARFVEPRTSCYKMARLVLLATALMAPGGAYGVQRAACNMPTHATVRTTAVRCEELPRSSPPAPAQARGLTRLRDTAHAFAAPGAAPKLRGGGGGLIAAVEHGRRRPQPAFVGTVRPARPRPRMRRAGSGATAATQSGGSVCVPALGGRAVRPCVLRHDVAMLQP